MDELVSEQSEPEIADLPFKNVGQVSRFLRRILAKLHRQMQERLDNFAKAFPRYCV